MKINIKTKSTKMNLKHKMLITIVGVLTASFSLKAQTSTYLPMTKAVEMAIQNNKNIRMADLERKIANANFHQTDAIFLPQLSVGYQAVTTNNPLNAFGFLLQQSSVTAQDFDPARLNNPGASQNYGASVDIRMPIFNFDQIYARKGAKLQEEVYKYKAQYTKDYIVFEIQKAYTQLQFAYQARNVLESTLSDVKQIYQSVQNFYQQGLVQKSDVLNALVQVNTVESALNKAKSNISNASDGLKLLMSIEQNQNGKSFLTDSLTQKEQSTDLYPVFSPLRADVLALRKAWEASNAMVKSSIMNFLPKINAFGSYQFNDAKIFRFKEDSYIAGISLSWTIFSGNQNRSKFRSANFQRTRMKLELDQYMDKSRLEMNKTARDLQDLNFEIRKQQTSVDQAAEALRIINNRYQAGLISTTDLLSAQAQLSQQKLLLAQTVMSYNITIYYQELLTSIK